MVSLDSPRCLVRRLHPALYRRALAAFAALWVGSAGAAEAASEDRRFRILQVESVSDLDFGKLAVLGAGGVARVSPRGTRYLFGDLENLGGSWGAATIEVKGKPRRPFIVVVNPFSPLISRHGGQVFLRKINCSVPRFGRLDETGRARFTCGGNLLVRSQTRSGHYKGRVRVWVAYL
ncbi:MAG: DUF4402 domain-containing protein [Pseudomonadota bacterium]